MYSYGPPHMAEQKQDDQHEHTFSSYVRIRDVVLKTCLGRWTIGRSGERGLGISMLPARHDDDDLLNEVVQSDKYYKSRAVGVTSNCGLSTDRDLSVPTCLRNTTSFIPLRYRKSCDTRYYTTQTTFSVETKLTSLLVGQYWCIHVW